MLGGLYSFNQVAGVAVHIQQDGSIVLDGCLLKLKQKQLQMQKKFTGLRDLAELSKLLPAGVFVALNLSGKGILNKRIEAVESISEANFGRVLPNAHINDFYIQNAAKDDHSFVSLIRKTDADTWFEQLQQMDLQPVSLSLGPFAVINLVRELNMYSGDIVFNHHVLTRDGKGAWLNYHYDLQAKAEHKIKIQSETMDERLVLPYAGAFQLLLHRQIGPVTAEADSYNELFRKRLDVLTLKANAAIVLGVFFALLLANFLVISWLNTSNADLSARVASTVQTSNQLKVNTEQLKQKEGLLHLLGWEGNTSKSVLINQITAMLPPDVTLTEINVNPVDAAATQQAKALTFFTRDIRISGTAEKVLSVNEWLARIKTKPWAKSVKLDSYAYNNELNTGVFTLNILF